MSLPVQQQPIPIGIPNFGVAQDPGRYVNAVLVRASQWDVAIDFFQQFAVPGSDPAQMVQQVACRTVMSPQHAKAFVHFLEKALATWEEQFGLLPSLDVLIPNQTSEEGDPHV
jgi:hypothetical protein